MTKRLFLLSILAVLAAAAVGAPDGKPPLTPDPRITPGDALAVTAKDVCVPGYSKRVRAVPQAVKVQAYKNYRITHRSKGEYEVDHLISLELGGSNSIKNLWPESYRTLPWNAHVKDQLENELHRAVCRGEVELKTAQALIANDWIGAYKKRFHSDVPLTDRAAVRAHRTSVPLKTSVATLKVNGAGAASADVWVNSRSGTYWRAGSRYYGKTKNGEFMNERIATKAGYRAGKGQ